MSICRTPIFRAVAFLGLIVVVYAIALKLQSPPRRFDHVGWATPADGDEEPRLEMADELIARSMLDDKTRAEVLSMLGEPNGDGYFTDFDLVYRLGMERGFLSIDSEWLVVRFDREERVAEYRIVRD